MIHQTLNGAWQVRENGRPEWLPGMVPGCIHTDLIAAGVIPDPFVGKNEKQVGWVAQRDWVYRRYITLDPVMLKMDRLFLVCDGLDTLAEVRLNGHEVGQAENMFRPYCWDVTGALQPAENELTITFASPVAYVRQHTLVRRMPELGAQLHGGPHLRKAASHFGWDWGPALPTTGIWRGIRLEGYRVARLQNVHLRQQHGSGNAIISVQAVCEVWGDAPLRLRLAVTGPDGVEAANVVQSLETGVTALDLSSPGLDSSVRLPQPSRDLKLEAASHFAGHSLAAGALAARIDHPQLWWPNGYGAQALYTVVVSLESGEEVLDQQSYQVGLRTLELRRQPDSWGNSFTFVINGVPIFCRGSNWIPADSFPTRVTPERLEHLLGSAAAANQNMLRVWGGGYYEDDYFYELCDRLGLLVWQDFMFACAYYPWDEDPFLENVKSEVVAAIRRLRHHACLALWCGNNEIEMVASLVGWSRGVHALLAAAYTRFFYRLLPEWVGTEDPDHPYWPSSPSSSEPFKETGSEKTGDGHLWQVFHFFRPFRHYRTQNHRFVSEFGFTALPALKTIASFATPENWQINSPVMRFHQRSPGGNDKILYYLLERFCLPVNFSDLVYLSQVLQAEGIRTGVEHWRRNGSHTSGALYWQLNDCWPAISWSSIDYFGRWKALHYASRRFYAPLLLSIKDEGLRMEVFVTNDRPAPWEGRLRWSLETLDGRSVEQREQVIAAAPLATAAHATLDFTRQLAGRSLNELVFLAELWQGEVRLSYQVALFAPEKDVVFKPPKIHMTIQPQGNLAAATFISDTLARFVELRLEGVTSQPVFSDNYFDLPAGRPHTVTFTLPDSFSLEQARTSFKTRSLADAAPAHSTAYGELVRRLAFIRAMARLVRSLI